jgi:two-component system, cell cycle sensor histidine kinase and response regulator CckA
MRTHTFPPVPRWLLTALMVLMLALFAVGIWFYQSQKDAMRQVIIRDLSAVAQLKVDQLVSWRAERLGNAELIISSKPLLRTVANFLADPQEQHREFIRSRFLSFQANHYYQDVVLLDPEGAIRLTLAGRDRILSDCCVDMFYSALAQRRPLFTHVYPDPTTYEPYLTVVAPLYYDSQHEAEAMGAVVLISNVREQLFPMIQSWPLPSDTADAYIVARDGDEVLVLSDVRHRDNAALELRISLNQTSDPGVAAVLGYQGMFEGTDYRGAHVVAAVYPVPGSPWFLVVKKDAVEIFAEWRFRALMISGLVTVLILCVGTFGILLWQRERKLYYEKLYASELQLRANVERHSIILKAIGDAVIATDASGQIELLNQVAEQLTGWSENEARGRLLDEVFFIINEETRDRVENPVTKVLRQGTIVGLANHTLLIARDGSERPIADSGAPIMDGQGKITGVVLVFRDQTEERRIELELRRSEELFRGFVENAHDMIYSLSPAGVFTYVSPNWTDFLGETAESPLGQCFDHLIHPDDLAIWRHFFEKTLIAVAKQTSPEYRVKFSDGSWRWHVSSGSPVKDEDGRISGFIGIARDVTEQVALRDQLLQSQKVEAVGRLAGGVAHDFNNMLGVILGNAELALTKITPADPLFKRLKQIINAAQRSAEVTRQLLAFARKQTIAPKVLDLNTSVGGMLQMLERLLGEDIDIAWCPASDLWRIRIDPSQLDQILANLCVNARDAIGGVGKITIETGNVSFDKEYCANHIDVFPGDYVLLAVSDDGCGIEKELHAKIFEPFFTTKGVGKGTGLGLATVHGIVKQNKGFINVYSELDKGTTFRIYLPRQIGEVEEMTDREASVIPSGHGETLLLVEDDQAILELAKTMLENHQYQVLAVSSPTEAIRLAQLNENSIALMVTDVVMPEMNGRDLAGIIQALQPDMKVLFMSGYTANVIAHHGVLDEGVHFIQKPFSVAQFALKVQQTLKG